MKTNQLIAVLFVVLFTGKSVAQQINFSGIRVMHTTGNRNLFIGVNTGISISTGINNVFVGRDAGINNTTANENTFIGSNTGVSNTASRNTFLGYGAGFANLGGDSNVFVGAIAGTNNTSGENNVFIGAAAGLANRTGLSNTFAGSSAGRENTIGQYNSFFGVSAGINNTEGTSNTFVGRNTGINNRTGNLNTLIGHQADVTSTSLTNAAAFGANARVAVNNAIVLGNPDNTSLAVGIGTDSPQFPLDVRGIINLRNRGTIKFSHLSNPTLLNGSTDQFLTVNEEGETVLARYRLHITKPDEWADRVFSANYALRPLAQVEQFVKANKHLPGIPSAEEVASQGVDPGQLTAKLLEKIEELTLYNIQLEKVNQSQQKQLNNQQVQLDEIRKLIASLSKSK